MIDFSKLTKKDNDKIIQIVDRAVAIWGSCNIDMLQLHQDIGVCHVSGCPLDLDQLLSSGPETFAHDIGGIMINVDRKTGKLRNGFIPRCAK